MMEGRYLVAFVGPGTGEWMFVALTWARSDAAMVAAQWHGGTIFDLLEWWEPPR